MHPRNSHRVIRRTLGPTPDVEPEPARRFHRFFTARWGPPADNLASLRNLRFPDTIAPCRRYYLEPGNGGRPRSKARPGGVSPERRRDRAGPTSGERAPCLTGRSSRRLVATARGTRSTSREPGPTRPCRVGEAGWAGNPPGGPRTAIEVVAIHRMTGGSGSSRGPRPASRPQAGPSPAATAHSRPCGRLGPSPGSVLRGRAPDRS